jgi:uncharacterized RDD family membrane protein YckC
LKYFITFALCAVVTVVLIHLIIRLLGIGEPDSITVSVPIAFLYLAFYGFTNPFTKTKSKE